MVYICSAQVGIGDVKGKQSERKYKALLVSQLQRSIRLHVSLIDTDLFVCVFATLAVTFRTAKAQPEPPEPARLTGRTKNSLSIKWLVS